MREDTECSGAIELVMGPPGPRRHTARTIRNPFVDRRRSKDELLAADPAETHQLCEQAVAEGEWPL